MSNWIPTMYGSNITEWATWNSGNLTCFDVTKYFVTRAYHSGLQDGLILGALIGASVIALIWLIVVKFAKSKQGEQDEN